MYLTFGYRIFSRPAFFRCRAKKGGRLALRARYVLPGREAKWPGPHIQHSLGDMPLVEMDWTPVRYHGMLPTQRIRHLLSPESIPKRAFTLEAWLLHHVNQPLGILVSAKGKLPGDPVPWCLGFHNWKSTFTMEGADDAMVQLQSRMKKWSTFIERHINGWFQVVFSANPRDLVQLAGRERCQEFANTTLRFTIDRRSQSAKALSFSAKLNLRLLSFTPL